MLTGLAKDKKEIGMLKAIGLSERDIRNIYFSKFLVLSIPGALLGEILAFVVEGPLSVQMQKLYGTGETQMQLYVVSVIAIILMECVLFTFIYFTLRKIEKLSAVEALRGTSETRHKKKGQFIVMGVAIAASLFMILIPQNLLSTISSSKFVTYMGIGNSQIRMDLRQTDDILYKTKELSEVLNADQRVEAYTALVTKKVQTRLLDGTNTTLLMEWGNHSIFPVSYISGGAPMKEGQLALSVLNAKDLKLNMGDKVYLSMKGIEQQYEICGIYSDITNGGKTAKAFTENLDLNETRDDTNMWSILYVSLHDDTGIDTWISDYQTKIGTGAGTGGKITDIKEYLDGTYGGTIRQIHLTSTFVLCVSCLISFIVILLFVRLMVEEKSMAYSLKKALGFTTRELRLEYLIQSLWIVVPAIVAGIISGIFLGEIITGNVIKSLGAAEFKFILNPWMVFVWVPFVMFCVVMLAVRLGLSGISKISAYECLTGKE
jgi:putative ABC transport system permease protein